MGLEFNKHDFSAWRNLGGSTVGQQVGLQAHKHQGSPHHTSSEQAVTDPFLELPALPLGCVPSTIPWILPRQPSLSLIE